MNHGEYWCFLISSQTYFNVHYNCGENESVLYAELLLLAWIWGVYVDIQF